MFEVTILSEGKKKQIMLNQKHICSIIEDYVDKQQVAEIKMSNGDIWHVIEPQYKSWHVDAWTTDTEY